MSFRVNQRMRAATLQVKAAARVMIRHYAAATAPAAIAAGLAPAHATTCSDMQQQRY
jgi:hypothetical protein